MKMSRQSNGKRLEQLLDQERKALLSADFQKIDYIKKQKSIILNRIQNGQVDEADLSPLLRYKVTSNQRLIESAMCGLQAALDHISNASRLDGDPGYYEKNGTIRVIGPSVTSVERRA